MVFPSNPFWEASLMVLMLNARLASGPGEGVLQELVAAPRP